MRYCAYALVLVIAVLGAVSASAQGLSIGARVGTDWSSSTHDPELTGVTFATHLGFAGGLQVDAWIDETWAISGQLLYDQKGFKTTSPATLNDIYTYLEIPVLLKGTFGTSAGRFYIEAGPSMGFKLSAKEDRGVILDVDSTITSTTLSLFLGAGISYMVSEDMTLVGDIGYAFGLSNISTQPVGTIKLSNIRFGIGTMFSIF